MSKIQTLDQIAYQYFYGSSFKDIQISMKQLIIDIQRNQILQSQLELDKSRIRDTTFYQ